jgi:hypothetical protein
VGHQLLLQRLCPIGQRNALLDMGPIALNDPLGQTAYGVRLPRQAGPQFFALGPLTGRRRRAIGVLQQCGHGLLGGALVGANRREHRDDGLFFLGTLLSLVQAFGWPLDGWLSHRHLFAIGLLHQDGRNSRWGGRFGWLFIEGRHISSSLHNSTFDGLEAERQPQNALEDHPALAVSEITNDRRRYNGFQLPVLAQGLSLPRPTDFGHTQFI